MNLDSEKLACNSLQENSPDIRKKNSFYNPFKGVLKTAATSKDRLTNILKQTFLKRRASIALVNLGEVIIEDDDDDCHEASMLEVDILRTFSPLIVHRQIHQSSVTGRLQPACKIHYGAVLFADISGFTRLANLLSVEQLQYHISRYFAMLFECVEQFGGDILKICGDAIMIMWPLENSSEKSTIEEKTACALTATLCGRELLLSCGTYRAYHGVVEINLTLHCGVGVADVPCYWVGRASRWEFLITGDALVQISSTEPEAKSGEIVISPQTYQLVKDHIGATLTPKGNYLLTVEILRKKLRREKATIPSVTGSCFDVELLDCQALGPITGLSCHPTLNFDHQRQIATSYLGVYQRNDLNSLPVLTEHPKMGRGLKYYVHRSARPRLVQMDHSLEFEMAELREVTTLFINITGLDEDFRLLKLEMIQKIMSAIVESHSSFGGALRQFVVDDKGCVAIGALGVPHHTFEDNCVRAVNIANALRQKIQKMGKNCSIGISIGSTFCGLVGSSNRREYAMMGSSVNLAARLMGSCPIGDIIVDERVRAASCELLSFVDMGTIAAKGYADPVPIFAFMQAAGEVSTSGSESFGDKLVIGRKSQLVTLRLAVKDFSEGTKGCEHQFHFLEGEEGIGKSLVARQVAAESKYRGLNVVVVSGSESFSNTPYWLLSIIFDQVMCKHKRSEKEESDQGNLPDLPPISSPTLTDGEIYTRPASPLLSANSSVPSMHRLNALNRFSGEDLEHLSNNSKTARFKEWIKSLLAKEIEYTLEGEEVDSKLAVIHGHHVMDIVHLIGELFREDIPVQGSTNRLLVTPRMHQLLLKSLITRALCEAFAGGTVLIVDNLQWCDLPSANALLDFISTAEAGFGVFCYRSSPTSRIDENAAFSNLRGACYCIPLQPLTDSEVSELVYHIIGSQHQSEVTKEKLSRILGRTHGIPGLVEILVTALRDELDRGLNPNIEDIRTPGQQSVVQRFDALDANLQLLLKTAATIGNVFSVAALRSIYDTLTATAQLQCSQSSISLTTIDKEKDATSLASNRPKSFTNFNNIQSRASAASEMFQRNNFEADILKLMELGMFSSHDFRPVHSFHRTEKKEVEVLESTDSPEIGIHSMNWHDARGSLRRGWAAIAMGKEMPEIPLCDALRPVPAAGDEGLLSECQISPPSSGNFYKFSHPSIQSTAYSLSLQLDRVPVHAATINYLSRNFQSSPGVEETCLYHAMHLKGTQEALPWLFKCTVSARDTQRHRLFVRNATQLVSMLVNPECKIRCGPGAEMEEQILNTLEEYMRRFGVADPPSHFPYSFDERESPLWSTSIGSTNKCSQWLLSIGCIMRDLLSSMVKIGEFRSVLSLYISSEKLLAAAVKRPPGDSPADGITKSDPLNKLNADLTQSLRKMFPSPSKRLSLPLEALEVDSGSDSETETDRGLHATVGGLPVLCKRRGSSIRSALSGSVCSERGDETIENLSSDCSRCGSEAENEKSEALHNGERSAPWVIDICAYSLPSLGPVTAAERVLTTHILAYIKGQEAIAIWNILRGNCSLAMLFTDDAISLIRHSCQTECAVLNLICLPRLLALKSLCYPVSHSNAASPAKCLSDALLWSNKAEEKPIAESVRRFHDSVQPHLPGLRQSHRPDSGKWVVLTVKAMSECSLGHWTAAAECFKAAQNELKDVNDKVTLFHVRMLEAWALFVTGNLSALHNKMRSITQHSRQSEERLIASSAGMLLAIRFSLSCLFDAAATLINKLGVPGSPLTSPISTPRGSAQGYSRSPSALFAGMTGPTKHGAQNIFLRVTEAFMISRRNPIDLAVLDIATLCGKLAARSPCTYTGGVYLFLVVLAGLAAYETNTSSEADDRCEFDGSAGIYIETDCDSDLTDFTAANTITRDGGLNNLLEEIEGAVLALEHLSIRHAVLLYMAKAVRCRLYRAKGMVAEAYQSILSTSLSPSQAAASVPLGVAYFQLETALCELSANSCSAALISAEASLKLFSLYEASIEINILRDCIRDSMAQLQETKANDK